MWIIILFIYLYVNIREGMVKDRNYYPKSLSRQK